MKCDLSDDFSVAMVGIPSVMLGLILGWTTANVPTVDITHEISSVFCKINAKQIYFTQCNNVSNPVIQEQDFLFSLRQNNLIAGQCEQATASCVHSKRKQRSNDMNSFKEVLADRGYDASFWENAVRKYWYENTGDDKAEWLDMSVGADFAYHLCWKFSDSMFRCPIYDMFDEALKIAFKDE